MQASNSKLCIAATTTPYQAIIEAAALSHCESGITGALLGSETVKVLTPGLSAEWTGRVPPLRD